MHACKHADKHPGTYHLLRFSYSWRYSVQMYSFMVKLRMTLHADTINTLKCSISTSSKLWCFLYGIAEIWSLKRQISVVALVTCSESNCCLLMSGAVRIKGFKEVNMCRGWRQLHGSSRTRLNGYSGQLDTKKKTLNCKNSLIPKYAHAIPDHIHLCSRQRYKTFRRDLVRAASCEVLPPFQ